jgi:dipeptidase D
MPASAISALEPQSVWSAFQILADTPRPSKQEERIRAKVAEWAAQHGFATRSDELGNMVIEVPGAHGGENAPLTVLQGHLDMVCEKNAGTQHDFDNDPIQLELANDNGEQVVRAKGTTLGADNGLGVALAMAAATDPDLPRPPLELLLTIDEEMGMSGAKALARDFFRGRRMLNLDSEEDDAIYIGCAGGMDTSLTWELPTGALPADAEVCQVTVRGLRGGHSGGDIHENRGNAIKVLVQTLRRAANQGTLHLASLTGGSKRNAIPREASAVVAGPAGTREILAATQASVADVIRADHHEPNIAIDVEAAEATAVATARNTQRLLIGLEGLPHGVLAVVPEIAGLVQTSNSVSTATTTAHGGQLRVVIGCLSRSSLKSALHAAARQIAAVGELAGATVESGNEYPGWAPDVNSPTLAVCKQVYEELFGETPKVAAIHAGLECGLIGERVEPDKIDMVSIGPRITGAHSPDEQAYVASVQKSWDYLRAILKSLAQG